MVVKAVVVGASLCLSTPAFPYFDTGNNLHDACSRESDFAAGLCMGIISGIFDGMQAMGYKCQTSGVTRQQARDVVVRHMINTPSERHHPAAFMAMESIIKAFSCKK